jgi:hypothetical protein
VQPANLPTGIYSYFLVVRADRNQAIPHWQKAVEGISGIAVVYTVAAMVFTCCLSGISFFNFTAIILDTLFIGGFTTIAVLTRHGASPCSGAVNTPLGIGNTEHNSDGFESGGLSTGEGEDLKHSISPRVACRLNTAAFAASIIAAFLFTITALVHTFLVRKRRMEKRFRRSTADHYSTSLAKRNFWLEPRKGC